MHNDVIMMNNINNDGSALGMPRSSGAGRRLVMGDPIRDAPPPPPQSKHKQQHDTHLHQSPDTEINKTDELDVMNQTRRTKKLETNKNTM